jgi:NitT/TauT family transport system substrate-binding protein
VLEITFKEEEMTLMRAVVGSILGAALCVPLSAHAADTVVFATTNGKAWDSMVVEYGRRKGFFAEAGIDIQYAVGDNPGLNLQVVISGSADIASVAVHTFMAAAIQGAPVRMVSSNFVGASDFLWYARSDSRLKSFADITEETTVGVNSLGASQYIILKSLLDQYGVNPQIVAVGSSAAGMTQVMTGQIDIATDGNGLLGVPQYANGEVRPLAFGREVEALRDVTVRGFVVTEETLAKRRDVISRFLQACQKTVDWMYSDPEAIRWFAEGTGTTIEEAARVREQSYPDGIINVGEILGLEHSIKQALDFDRIDRAPTDEELAKMFDIVWSPPSR